MAHQAHSIPWTLLASHLHLARGCQYGVPDLHLRPRSKPTQAKQLTYFADAFARNVAEHAVCERRKYRDTYAPPAADDVIVDERTARKIQRSVQRVQDNLKTQSLYTCWKCWESQTDRKCRCPSLPVEERTAAAFLRQHESNPCYRFYAYNGERFYNVEIVKLLLLYGEMEPVLRVCAHPDVDLKKWWTMRECMCELDDLGWDRLCKTALTAYIGLNVLHCFPETWDEASGRTDETDYRRTGLYQYMLRTCTGAIDEAEVSRYPHRQFFGVSDGQFYGRGRLQDKEHWLRWAGFANRHGILERYPYGLLSFEEFLSLERPAEHWADESDIPAVRWMLCRKGLPVELALEVLRFAGYEAREQRRRLREPHDPFHWRNRDEMARYLRYCWQVLVRSDVMARELGMEIPWQSLVTECVGELLGSEFLTSEYSRWDFYPCLQAKWIKYHIAYYGSADCNRWVFV